MTLDERHGLHSVQRYIGIGSYGSIHSSEELIATPSIGQISHAICRNNRVKFNGKRLLRNIFLRVCGRAAASCLAATRRSWRARGNKQWYRTQGQK